MVKLNLTSGGILYSDVQADILKQLLNSANNGRTVVFDCYKEQALTTKVTLNLINLEYFEAI